MLAVVLLDGRLSQTDTSSGPDILLRTGRCIVVLFGTSLSEYALPNASQTAANTFIAE